MAYRQPASVHRPRTPRERPAWWPTGDGSSYGPRMEAIAEAALREFDGPGAYRAAAVAWYLENRETMPAEEQARDIENAKNHIAYSCDAVWEYGQYWRVDRRNRRLEGLGAVVVFVVIVALLSHTCVAFLAPTLARDPGPPAVPSRPATAGPAETVQRLHAACYSLGPGEVRLRVFVDPLGEPAFVLDPPESESALSACVWSGLRTAIPTQWVEERVHIILTY